MATVFDYLKWRGDLSFAQDPLNPVDGLIFCALSYIPFVGQAAETPNEPIALRDAAADFLSLDDYESRVRAKNDAMMLRAAAETARFGGCKMVLYRDQFAPEEETQFAAMTFLLPDDTAFVAFRGTDRSLVGWKEDFNMAFQEAVPAQLLAQDYVREVAAEYVMPLRLGGHSKGGNLAVFAAARSTPDIQQRILEVYNNDGPGFTDYLMGDPGYLAMVPRIKTYVPQSSVIGMLLEHEEAFTIVESRSVGIYQHNVYQWEIARGGFVELQQLSASSQLMDRALKDWVAAMPAEDRGRVINGLYAALSATQAETVRDVREHRKLAALKAVMDLDPETRALTLQAARLLYQSLRRSMPQKDMRDVLEKLPIGALLDRLPFGGREDKDAKNESAEKTTRKLM